MMIPGHHDKLPCALTLVAKVQMTRRQLMVGASALGLVGVSMVPGKGLAQSAIDSATIPGPAWAGGTIGGRAINVWGDTSVDFDP